MSSSQSRLREQNRVEIVRSLLLLLVLDIVLAVALISTEGDPGAALVRDLFRYLFGLVSLVVMFYFGNHLRKHRSILKEVRIEARLRIQSRDKTGKR